MTDGTNTNRTTAATRPDETAREHELTKTAQQDNADTRTPTHETRTGRHHETKGETKSGTPPRDEERDDERDETPSPRPPYTRNEKKRHAMPSPPCPRHTAIIA